MTARREAVVVGAGHNGLTCAAYLARAGVDVLVLEARDTVGGCASTVEALGGARVNVCNCDHSLIRATGIVEELELAAHGLRYHELDPSQIAAFWDGAAPWPHFRDPQRTLESIALTHPAEVPGYRRYLEETAPAARLLARLLAVPATPGAVARELARARGRGAATILRLSRLTLASALRRWFVGEALLAPAATTGPAVWGLPPQAAGTGLGALGYAMRHLVPAGRPIGGSGALTEALAGAVGRHGGEIETGVRVTRIVCDAAGAQGVETADGRRIAAGAVIVSTDPRTAIVDWLTDPPARALSLVRRWRERPVAEGYESKVDAVVATLPRLRALGDDVLARLGVPADHGTTTVVSPTLAGIGAAHAAMRAGRVAEHPLFLTNVPSLPDPSVAPPGGGHVLSLEVLFTPYRLRGGWPGSAEPERWLSAYAELLEPGFLDGVRAHRLVGPEDYERDFHLRAGNAPSFAGGPLAALLGGSAPELTRYATPVRGLYLTGAATYPGAGISGASGRNAAAVVLRALGVEGEHRRRAPSG